MKEKKVGGADENHSSQDDPKIGISARIRPILKGKISQVARATGVHLSDVVEMWLANYMNLVDSGVLPDSFLKSADEAASLITEMETSNNKLFEENECLKREIVALNQKFSVLAEQAKVLFDPDSLKLFEQFKGHTDQIVKSDGTKILITYNTVSDLVKAMFYTVKFKP